MDYDYGKLPLLWRRQIVCCVADWQSADGWKVRALLNCRRAMQLAKLRYGRLPVCATATGRLSSALIIKSLNITKLSIGHFVQFLRLNTQEA